MYSVNQFFKIVNNLILLVYCISETAELLGACTKPIQHWDNSSLKVWKSSGKLFKRDINNLLEAFLIAKMSVTACHALDKSKTIEKQTSLDSVSSSWMPKTVEHRIKTSLVKFNS